MSKAPTEAHLEQWIVDNFNDFIDPAMMPYPIFDYVDRQVKLPSGKCDLFGIYYEHQLSQSVCICEIKKGMLDLKCLAQLLRYFRDIRLTWYKSLTGLPMITDLEYDGIGTPSIKGVLVGYEIDEDVLIACEALEIIVFLYSYDESKNTYSFQWINNKKSTVHQPKECAVGTLRSVIRSVYLHSIENHIPSDIINKYSDLKWD